MKVVILCGGYGTRIRDVADDIPKPMIPIGPFPILWHIMKYYAGFGHTEFILCLGYKGRAIKDFFLNYEAHIKDFTIKLGDSSSITFHSECQESEWRVTLAETGVAAMTGTRIAKIRRYLSDEEEFMLTYGDGVGNIDLNALLDFHQTHGKTLTVTGVRPPGRFGELVTNASGLVSEFAEKPQATNGLISGGFFVCNRKLFNYLDATEDLVFEQRPMKKLVAEGELAVYEHSGFWQPMDTYREYQLLNGLFESGKAPWVNW
jgi:glucose-1-phosphate cytidylyltransferase